MEYIKVKDLNFKYPNREEYALKDINLQINRGDFILIFGKSGSGKTTLINQFKEELKPNGDFLGNIYIEGINLDQLSERGKVQRIGLIGQNPNDQIITDKVWHELAFGLENLGFSQEEMHTRVSEIASYFNFDEIFHKSTYELSGGQKQLLNLASVMIMNPEILILDEPTSRLDPIQSSNFINMVQKINEELGTTIIMTEHELDLVFPLADDIYLMDKGRIKKFDLDNLSQIDFDERILSFVPSSVEIAYGLGKRRNLPKTVKEGRKFLTEFVGEKKYSIENNIENKDKKDREEILSASNIYFRYEKEEADVIKELNLKVYEGEKLGIIGGNGTGKSTLLKLLSKIIKPYSGKLKYKGKKYEKINSLKFYENISALSQDVENIFSNETVLDELKEMTSDIDKINNIVKDMELESLLKSHPFDLSEGEKQRVALAKIILKNSEVLILDEPTKGMDGEFKEKLGMIFNKYLKDKTLIIVSHDIDFLSRNVDRIGFLFDGEITAIGNTREILTKNIFYTTQTNRITRNIVDGLILPKDVIELLEEKNE